MILLRRLGGPLFTLNPDLIERAEATPDTVVTLIGGNKYVVCESLDELVELIRDYRARIIATRRSHDARDASTPTPTAASSGQPRMRVLSAADRPGQPVVPLRQDGFLMDPSLIIGVVLALVAIVGSVTMEGGNIARDLPARADDAGLRRHHRRRGRRRRHARRQVAAQAADPGVHRQDPEARTPRSRPWSAWPAKARREGLLALESEAAEIEDEFLRRGLQLAIDGTDAEEVAIILGDRGRHQARHRQGRRPSSSPTWAATPRPSASSAPCSAWSRCSGTCPRRPSSGAEIASAFVATLWGVMSANVFWLPLANRLKRVSEAECEQMELVIEGILAIQAGCQPAAGRAEAAQPAAGRQPASAERGRGLMSAGRRTAAGRAGGRGGGTRRSTRTTSAGWSPTPTCSPCCWCCSSCCTRSRGEHLQVRRAEVQPVQRLRQRPVAGAQRRQRPDRRQLDRPSSRAEPAGQFPNVNQHAAAARRPVADRRQRRPARGRPVHQDRGGDQGLAAPSAAWTATPRSASTSAAWWSPWSPTTWCSPATARCSSPRARSSWTRSLPPLRQIDNQIQVDGHTNQQNV